MTLYNEVFERTEKKYRLDARQHRQMVEALAGHLALDAFGITKITSLYFDTPGRALIERSLDKPLYKEKLRLRRYGEAAGEAADEDGCVFVEIKKKYKGRGVQAPRRDVLGGGTRLYGRACPTSRRAPASRCPIRRWRPRRSAPSAGRSRAR